jgi:integrase/recombinase XerD
MVGLTKQAAYLNEKQVKNALARTRDYRNALRNRAVVELTVYAGLRAKEVASLRWEHILDEDGEVGEVLRLTNDASKGKSGGLVPLNSTLRETLGKLRELAIGNGGDGLGSPVIVSERGAAMQRQSIVNLLRAHYQRCDIQGASSHSGRRTFITNVARRISVAGGSMRDVQALARHANLQTTQRYVEENSEAQRQVVEMLL